MYCMVSSEALLNVVDIHLLLPLLIAPKNIAGTSTITQMPDVHDIIQ
jgi:hypothetical protein